MNCYKLYGDFSVSFQYLINTACNQLKETHMAKLAEIVKYRYAWAV